MTSASDTTALLQRVLEVLHKTSHRGEGTGPSVTLTYAQSLDGCITAEVGAGTPISGQPAQVFTHQLRAMHDGILIGVETVLIDNPRLTVRLAEGRHPRPIVLDSRLRTPPDARLLSGPAGSAIIATSESACGCREAALREAGAEILRFPTNGDRRVQLSHLFYALGRRKIGSVMVEGGARVITSMLTERAAHQLVLTISPDLLGGLRAVGPMRAVAPQLRPRLQNALCQPLGSDVIVQGELEVATA